MGGRYASGFSICGRLIPSEHFVVWLRGSKSITLRTAFLSAFVGAYSHVLLDATTHADVHPFAPFDDRNPLLGLATLGGLTLICIGVGILGMLGMVVAYLAEAAQERTSEKKS